MIAVLFIRPIGIVNQELADGETLQNILKQHWSIVGCLAFLAFCITRSLLSFMSKSSSDESSNLD